MRRSLAVAPFHVLAILAEARCRIHLRAIVERLLSGLQILVIPVPRFERGILERTAIRERELPWFGSGRSIDRVEMDRRDLIVLPTREEDDARNRRRDVPAQHAECRFGHVLDRSLARAVV